MSVLARHLLVGGCSVAIAATGVLTAASAALATSPASSPVRQPPPRSAPAARPAARPPLPVARPVRRAPLLRRRPARPATVRPAPQDPYARFGFDISWPQCRDHGAVLPPAFGPVAIVGVTGGRPFTTNPCLRAEWAWARSRTSSAGYLNLAAPRSGDPFAYGAATARDALARARSEGVRLHSLWLDVEIGNHWAADAGSNRQVVRGAITALKGQGVSAGVYSTPLDWRQITRGASLTVPIWMAVRDGRKIGDGCASTGFGGRTPDLIQAVFSAPDRHEVDGDLICTSRADFVRMLR